MRRDNGTTQEASIRVPALLMFSAGAFLGVAAAFALAPTRGRDTLAYIGRRGRAVAGVMSSRGTMVRRALSHRGERLTLAVRRGYDRVVRAVEEPKNDAHEPRGAT